MPTTYYIDHDNGANTNNGTSKATAWKSHPYMQTATGCTTTGSGPVYTHVAGDQFIFKGGVTWPAACFQLNVPSGKGGSSISVQDYYGVDKTWFTGSSFARPLFDMTNNTAVGGPMIKVTSSQWITFDNLELAHLMVAQQVAGTCKSANMDLGGSGTGNIVVKNLYIHDWTIAQIINGSTGHETGSICQNGGLGGITVDTVEIHDQNPAAYSTNLGLKTNPFGACFRNLNEIKNSNCHHAAEGEVGLFGAIHDNQIHDMTGNAILAYDANNHSNILETGANESVTIYNNAIYNTTSGVTLYIASAAGAIYNNVMWSNNNDSIKISAVPISGSENSGTTLNVYNNTIDCSNGNHCFGVDAKGTLPGTVNLKNNIWVTNGTNAECVGTGSCSAITTFNHSNNPVISTATAATDGLTSARKYAPSASDATYTGAGLNLTTLATGALANLVNDCEGALWFGGSYQARGANTSTGTCGGTSSATPCWDIGAHKIPPSNSTPPSVAITSPPVGTVSGTQTLTMTCTPVSPATIASVQFQVDGTNFGASGSTSPYSLTWDTTTASNASHTIVGICTDSATLSGSATETVTVSNNIPGCFVSSNNWTTNQSFAIQSGSFTATFSVTANANNLDDVVGFSSAAAGAFTDLATIIRFNSSGNIDVRNAGVYQAVNTVAYTSGNTYAFSMAVNIPAHTYSVQLTSPSNTTLATNYAFRSEQSSVGSLSWVNMEGAATPNTAKFCNLVLSGGSSGSGGSNNLAPATKFTATLF